MNYKITVVLLLSFFMLSCEQTTNNAKFNFENRYKNSGFALVYNSLLDDIKEIEP